VQDALKELRKEIDGGITKPGSESYTVRQCCEGWLTGGLPGRDPNTVAMNRHVLEPVLTVAASGCGTWTSPTSTKRSPRPRRRAAVRRWRWRTKRLESQVVRKTTGKLE
jgi:hypothetical protein